MDARSKIRSWASKLKAETYALYLASRDPRVPWYAKALAVCVVGYALSPIDLIPDFIPVIGYLDDLVVVPAGLAVAIKLIPVPVLAECRERAADVLAEGMPVSRAAAAIVIGTWLLLAALCVFLIVRAF